MNAVHQHHRFLMTMLDVDEAWAAQTVPDPPLLAVDLRRAFREAGVEFGELAWGVPYGAPAIAVLDDHRPVTVEYAWWDGVQVHRVGSAAGPHARMVASMRLENEAELSRVLFPDRFQARVLTHDGRFVNLLDGWGWDVDVMAHALAAVNRFCGHTGEPYSVAQHSVHVHDHVEAAGGDADERRAALFHDAPETILGDVTAPLKRLLPGYKLLEERHARQLAEVHRLPYPWPARVVEADMRMLQTERRDLMPNNPEPWSPYVEQFTPYPHRLEAWGHERAAETFRQRARALGLIRSRS